MTTSTQKQFADIAARQQESITRAVQSWTDTVQDYTQRLAKGQPGVPNVRESVNSAFDVAEQLLHTQRQLVVGLLDVGTETGETVRKATEQFARKSNAHGQRAAEETRTGTRGSTSA